MLCITGPDSGLGVIWKYIGSGSGGTTGSLQEVIETTSSGNTPLVEVSYNGSGLPQYLYNADELAPGYSGSTRVTIGYTGSPAQVSSISNGTITGQVPTTTSTWSFNYTPCSINSPPSSCYTNATAYVHGSLAAGSTRQAAGYTFITPPCQQTGAVCSGRAGGEQIEVFYDFYGREMERVDELGNYTQEQYNAQGQLEWAEDQAGNPTDYAYDQVNDTLTSVTGPPDPGNGNTRPVTSYHYDEAAVGTPTGAPTCPGQH